MQSNDRELKTFTTQCSEDEDGNLILDIPEELLEAMGWAEGTELDLEIIGDRLVLREVQRSTHEESA
jgi:antitoxin component of MazEF toxin-antitoxin module